LVFILSLPHFHSLHQHHHTEAFGLHSVSTPFLPVTLLITMYFTALALTSFFFTLARSAALQPRDFSGKATFYGGNLHGGACSFSTYTLPAGMFGTALSDSNWADAQNCGACISVTGPGGNSISAMVRSHFVFSHLTIAEPSNQDRRPMSWMWSQPSRSLP